jgi:hypothetical protein
MVRHAHKCHYGNAAPNMDKMVGKQFEEGLANLKRLAEGG